MTGEIVPIAHSAATGLPGSSRAGVPEPPDQLGTRAEGPAATTADPDRAVAPAAAVSTVDPAPADRQPADRLR
jgi:hypothetical protein